MKKNKRPLILKIVWITILCITFFIFSNQPTQLEAEAASAETRASDISITVSTEDIKKWSVTSNVTKWDDRVFNSTPSITDFYRVFSLTITKNGNFKITTENEYTRNHWEGDYYWEYDLNWTVLDESSNESEWYDSTNYHNNTGYETGWTYRVKVNGKTVTSNNLQTEISGLTILEGYNTVELTLALVYIDGYSYDIDSRDCYFYNYTMTGQILISDHEKPTIGIENNTYYNHYLYNINITDNMTLSQIYYYHNDSRWPNSYSDTKTSIATNSSSKVITSFTKSGFYELYAIDTWNNSTVVKFVIDPNSPQIAGVQQNAFYNSAQTINVYDTISGINNIKVNGSTVQTDYNNNYKINISTTTTQQINIECTDRANNKSTLSFWYDVIAPTITGIDDNAVVRTATITYADNTDNFLNQGFKGVISAKYGFSAEDKPSSATTDFTSGKTFTDEGYYIIEVTDRAGNVSQKRFTIDKTDPTINGVINNGYYKSSQTLSFYDKNGISKVKVNGTEISNTSSYQITAEGTHFIEVTDKAGNVSSIQFTIDKTDPGLSVNNFNNFSNNTYYSSNYLTITANEIVTYQFDGQKVAENTSSVSLYARNYEPGRKTLTATDKAGNISTIYLYFDTTAPNLIFRNSKLVNSIYYAKQTESVEATSSYSPILETYYTFNGGTATYISSNPISLSNEGTYIITTKNKAGMITSKKLIIDKTTPNLIITSKGTILENNSYTNQTISISFNDSFGINEGECFYSFNNSEQKALGNSSSFSEAGSYDFWVTDIAGNIKTQRVIIEMVPPTISGVENNTYYNQSKTLTFFDEGSGIKEVKINNKTITLTNNQYRVSSTEASRFDVTCIDQAGNTASLTFHMDSIAPTANIDKKYYNYDFKIQIVDYMLDSASHLQKNENPPTYLPSSSSTSISTSGDGNYTLYLIDKAGNTSSYTFTIDTVPPEGVLSGYTSFKNSIYYGNASSILTFTYNEEEATASFNNTSYSSGNSIYATTLEDGSYSFVLTDKAGNSSTYEIDLKSSIPVAIITGYYSVFNQIYYVNNTSVLNISWSDPTAYAIFNDNEYRKDFTIICSTLENDTNYEILLRDTYGNESCYSFFVDKTPDTNNFDYLSKNNYSWINHWFNTYEYNYSNYTFVKGNDYSFSTIEEATDYAWNRENSTVDTIKYNGQTIFSSELYGTVTEFYDYENIINVSIGDNVYLYKSLATASKIVVYFDYQNLYEAIQHYMKQSIEEKYRFFDNTSSIKKPFNEKLTYDYFYINQSSYTLNRAEATTTISVSKDNSSYITYTNKAILSEGYNYIREIDRAGNSFEYVVVLNVEPITYSVITPGKVKDAVYTSTLKNEHILHSSSSLALSLNSNFPEHNIIKIQYTSLNNEQNISYIVDNGVELTQEGTYIIDTYDIFGNRSNTYTIYILYSAPQTNSEITKIDGIIIDLNFEIIYQKIVENQITNILVQFTDIEGNSSYLFKDAYDTPITTKTTNLTFVESGTYTLMITDIFGNSSTTTEVLQKGKPFGQLYAGNPATAVPSGTITNQAVYFSFNTEYEYTCTLNGAKYSSGTSISMEGIFEFILSNADSTAIYTIEIDKTAPTTTLFDKDTIIDSGTTTSSKGIYMTWEEENLTVLLNGIPYEKNTILKKEGKNVFKISDVAGNLIEKIITIDWTAPKVRIISGKYEVESGAIVNARIKFEWDESNCTAYCNGVLYTSGKLLTIANTYSLTITDRYGNSAIYTCTLDLSTPEFQIFDGNGNQLESGAKINKGFYVTWEGDYTVYLDDAIYTKEAVISTAKQHSIKVINVAGTIVTSYISISYESPIAYLYDYDDQVLPSGTMTNKRFYISWNDTKTNRYTCTLNDTIYQKGKIITTDGVYVVTITDEYGNSTLYSLIRDTIPPIGSLSGVKNESITNQNVTFTWEEENCTVLLDNLLYTKDTIIFEEGLHQILITDLAGNSNTYSFTIDKTPPKFSLSQELNDNNYSNKRLSITWNETQCTAVLNGKSYLKETLISDGIYEFILTDLAGNTSSIQFTIDRSAPTLLITGIDAKGNTNKPVTISWQDAYEVTINGVKIESGYIVETDGVYEVIALNLAGNSNTYTFEISTQIPTGILNGVENNSITNQTVSFYFETPSTATLNNQVYTSGTTITKEGNYTIVLTDKFSNKNTYTFTIDKTPPIATLIGVKHLGTTNKDVVITFNEVDAVAVLNGIPYTSGTSIYEEGTYELRLSDAVGNTSTYSFTIDKTPPTAILNGVENGKTTNQSVFITWSEVGCTAYLNEKNYTSGAYIREEGNYEFKIIDKLGNAAFYTFSIDKTAPDILIYDESLNELKPNSIINHPFYIIWNEENCTAVINDNPYHQELITESGEYNFIIEDSLGNQRKIYMKIDLSAPIATLYGVENGATTNQNVYLEFKSNCTVLLNNEAYTSGKKITEEGYYIAVVQNNIGNTTTYTFQIDKTAPSVQETLGLNENNYSNSNVWLLFDEEDATATLNGTAYFSGDLITEEGTYELCLSDAVGNTSSFFFWIKKSIPKGVLNGVENAGYTNKVVTFAWQDKNSKATLNGVPYTSDTPISNDGTYEILLTDLAGNFNTYTFEISTAKPTATLDGINEFNLSNSKVKIFYKGCECLVNNLPYNRNGYEEEGFYTVILKDKYGNSSTYTFTIDKTPPIAELTGVDNGGFTNKPVYINWLETNCIAYLNNTEYDKGSSIRVDGEYTFVLMDKAGNSSTYTFEISQKLPQGNLIGLSNEKNNYTNQDVIFSWEEKNCTALLNGSPYTSGTSISEEGEYVILLTNKFGNTATYTFIIDKTAPDCSLVGVDNGGFTNKKVTLDYKNEKNLSVYVNGELFEKTVITSNNFEEYNGSYNVKVFDLAGNATEFNFEYFFESEESLKEKLSIIPSQDNTSVSISYQGEYILTINDEQTLNNTILESEGNYQIVLSDKFGNTYSTKIKLKAPDVPNYMLKNIATILSIVLVCVFVGFIVIKKFFNNKNPYRKNK